MKLYFFINRKKEFVSDMGIPLSYFKFRRGRFCCFIRLYRLMFVLRYLVFIGSYLVNI
mgnify:CR=1 FL=1